jgi:hypothetical protein
MPNKNINSKYNPKVSFKEQQPSHSKETQKKAKLQTSMNTGQISLPKAVCALLMTKTVTFNSDVLEGLRNLFHISTRIS